MKADKENILTGLQGEDRELAARALDLAYLVKKQHQTRFTDFCNPAQQQLLLSRLEQIDGLAWHGEGGYPGAERQRLALYPDYESDCPAGTVCLEISGHFPAHNQPGHRDYLGALLGLGIKRGKLGDILVDGQTAQVIVAEEIGGFIEANLNQVGSWRVEIRAIAPEELRLAEQTVKEIRCTLASLRVDALAAAGYGLSRTKMAGEIKAQHLSLNWKPCLNPAASVKAGDVLSLRGKGRLKVVEVEGKSRKGRIFVLLNRLL